MNSASCDDIEESIADKTYLEKNLNRSCFFTDKC